MLLRTSLVAAISLACCAAAHATGDLLPAGTVVTVGGGVSVQPTYEGGKDYEALPFGIARIGSPMDDPFQTTRGFFNVDFATVSDVGLGIFRLGNLTVGPAIGYRFDRDEDDGDPLRGLGDVDGGLVVGGFARYNFRPFYVRASYLTQVTGDEDTGGVLRLQAGSHYRIAPNLWLRPFAAVEIGDDDYMQTYFGVTAAQSARSGLGRFDASAGAKSLHLGLDADLEIFPTWTLRAGAEYVELLGDAADSPVVEEESQFRARIGLAKSFTLGR